MSEGREPCEILAFLGRDVSAVFGLAVLYTATFAALWSYGNWSKLVLAVFLIPMLIWLSIHDLQTFELPDIGTLAVTVIGSAYVAVMAPQALPIHIATAVGLAAFFWLLGEVYYRWFGQEGLGIGDAKLFGAGALLLGPWQIPELVLLPSLGGIVFHFVCRFRRRGAYPAIPFGPFIAYAIFTLSFLDPIFL